MSESEMTPEDWEEYGSALTEACIPDMDYGMSDSEINSLNRGY